MVARRGKCPKNHFFCIFGLLLYKYKIYQVGQEFRKLFDILVHPTFHWSVYTVVPRSTLLKMISFNVSPLRNPSLQISRKHSEVWRHFPPFIEMFTKDFMIFTGPRCLWGLVYGSRFIGPLVSPYSLGSSLLLLFSNVSSYSKFIIVQDTKKAAAPSQKSKILAPFDHVSRLFLKCYKSKILFRRMASFCSGKWRRRGPEEHPEAGAGDARRVGG